MEKRVSGLAWLAVAATFVVGTACMGTYYPLPYESSVSDSFTVLPAS
jgi:hypothetical protein